eukprot:scaffold885_cov58-Attheya_sp.AAC.6
MDAINGDTPVDGAAVTNTNSSSEQDILVGEAATGRRRITGEPKKELHDHFTTIPVRTLHPRATWSMPAPIPPGIMKVLEKSFKDEPNGTPFPSPSLCQSRTVIQWNCLNVWIPSLWHSSHKTPIRGRAPPRQMIPSSPRRVLPFYGWVSRDPSLG